MDTSCQLPVKMETFPFISPEKPGLLPTTSENPSHHQHCPPTHKHTWIHLLLPFPAAAVRCIQSMWASARKLTKASFLQVDQKQDLLFLGVVGRGERRPSFLRVEGVSGGPCAPLSLANWGLLVCSRFLQANGHSPLKPSRHGGAEEKLLTTTTGKTGIVSVSKAPTWITWAHLCT